MTRPIHFAIVSATALLASVAAVSAAPVRITTPTDDIASIRHDSVNQYSNFVATGNGETEENAVDNNLLTKSLIFSTDQPGYIITPAAGPTAIIGLRLATANDFPNRDPLQVVVQGTNTGTGSDNLLNTDSDSDYTTIYTGTTGLTAGETPRNTYGSLVTFANTTAYKSYRLYFTALNPIGTDVADSMQISELELYADNGVPEPTSLGLLGLGGLALLRRRR